MAYPELIYLYVEDFGYCFQKQEFVFSLNHDIQYSKAKDRTLIITPKENPFEEMYGADITNISLLVGSNGSGKTSVMELLARPEAFAKDLQKRFPGKTASMGWFAVYAVDVLDVGEARKTTYYLEGWNNQLISNFTEKPSQTEGTYSCCFCMQEDKIACFSRGDISDKLQLYYCPVNCRSFSVGEGSDKGVLKRAVERSDSGIFSDLSALTGGRSTIVFMLIM